MIQKKRSVWKKIAASILGSIIIGSGFFHRCKKEMLSGKIITGLFFHNPSRNQFEHCIQWLKEQECVFISSQQLFNILENQQEIPPRAVWVTIDDGWKENMSEIAPVLLQQRIPATFFITTGPIEKGGAFWFNTVRHFPERLPPLYTKNTKKLWKVKERIRREIVAALENTVADSLTREAMTVDNVQFLSTLPGVTIGTHTVNHPLARNCTDEELMSEIMVSKEKIEQWTNRPVQFFAYPHGSFSGKESNLLREMGIKIAATTKKAFITNETNRHFVPRFCVNDEAFFPETVCQMVGAWGKVMNLFPSLKK